MRAIQTVRELRDFAYTLFARADKVSDGQRDGLRHIGHLLLDFSSMYDFIVQRTNSFTVEGTAVAWRQYALRSFDVFGDSYLTGDQVRRVYCLGVSFCSSAAHQIVPGLKMTSQQSKVATVKWLQGFDISSLLLYKQEGDARTAGKNHRADGQIRVEGKAVITIEHAGFDAKDAKIAADGRKLAVYARDAFAATVRFCLMRFLLDAR